jgi:hypothetical protein
LRREAASQPPAEILSEAKELYLIRNALILRCAQDDTVSEQFFSNPLTPDPASDAQKTGS